MTREEVKTALKCCGHGDAAHCDGCPLLHSDDDCMILMTSALEVINQLEAENSSLREQLNNSGAYVTISTATAATCKAALHIMDRNAEKTVRYWNRLRAADPSNKTKRDAFWLACLNVERVKEAIAEMAKSEAV